MSDLDTVTNQVRATHPRHFISQHPLFEPWPESTHIAVFGMGCFWGAERLFWSQKGVYVTMVGYCGGAQANPTYEKVCNGTTEHVEAVRIVFDPSVITYKELLALFWENHRPDQGMRQGNDIGTQYRSCIFTQHKHQRIEAEASKTLYQQALTDKDITGVITTKIEASAPFYYAESYHQQYLAKNPDGYCGLGGSGVCMPK